MPVQRWFGYREGYSVDLVKAFIRELNITRNILDPFSGSGTTLLAARNANLQSFGVEVNPLSVMVATCGNSLYDTNDMLDLAYTITQLKK